MSNVAQLKKTAVEHEQKRRYDKALELYVQLLDEMAAADEEPDVALHNHVGDLELRLRNVAGAVAYYTKAADLYAAGGFLNNAAALCHKILRHDPTQSGVYRTLARISARNGFQAEAKHHLLEYAGRMQRAGAAEESARAFEELAALSGDQTVGQLAATKWSPAPGRSDVAVETIAISRGTLRADAALTADAGNALDHLAARPAAAPVGDSLADSRGDLLGYTVADDAGRVDAHHVAPRDAAAGGLSDERGMMIEQRSAPLVIERDLAISAQLADRDAGQTTIDASALLGLEPTSITAPESSIAPGLLTLDRGPGDNEPLAVLDGLETLPQKSATDADGPRLVLDRLDDVEHSPAPLSITPVVPLELDFVDLDQPQIEPQGGTPLPMLPMLDGFDSPVDAHSNMGGPDGEALLAIDTVEWVPSLEPAVASLPGSAAVTQAAVGAAAPLPSPADDDETHYELGLAFRQVGLLDDAIAEFQLALRSGAAAPRTYEALGDCYVDSEQYQMAVSFLAPAVDEPSTVDSQLVGVLYLLGRANEGLGRHDDALAFYQRASAADVTFRDVSDRLHALERTS